MSCPEITGPTNGVAFNSAAAPDSRLRAAMATHDAAAVRFSVMAGSLFHSLPEKLRFSVAVREHTLLQDAELFEEKEIFETEACPEARSGEAPEKRRRTFGISRSPRVFTLPGKDDGIWECACWTKCGQDALRSDHKW